MTGPTLPDEIIVYEVLTRLPVKLVARFRCVSKLWNSLLSEPVFIQALLNSRISQDPKDDYLIFGTKKFNGATQLPDGVSILSRSKLSEICMDKVPYPVDNRDFTMLIGSVNGLVCIACFTRMDSWFNSYHFILWNPAINLSKKILLSKDCPSEFTRCTRFLFGFGLDSEANDYKIIMQSTDLLQAVVYSCQTDSWISIADSKFSAHTRRRETCWLPSVIVKGICYWECLHTTTQVLKFDPRNNEFTYLKVPFVRQDKNYQLVNLNDCLARVEYEPAGEDFMDVYIYNEDCSLWSKIYTTYIRTNDIKSIETCFKNDGMMVVFHFGYLKYSFCDVKSNEIKNLACDYDRRNFKYFSKGFSYTPSLVALEGMKSLHP